MSTPRHPEKKGIEQCDRHSREAHLIQKGTAGTVNMAPGPSGRTCSTRGAHTALQTHAPWGGTGGFAHCTEGAPPSAGEDALPDGHPAIHPTRTGSPESKLKQGSHSVSSPLPKSLKSEGLNFNSSHTHTHTHTRTTHRHTQLTHMHTLRHTTSYTGTHAHNSYIHMCADTHT